MIVDYRIYGTVYAILTVAWVVSLPLMHFQEPRLVNRWMSGVAIAAVLTGLMQYLDWLWS